MATPAMVKLHACIVVDCYIIEDNKECDLGVPCEYGCSNSPGSYECTCPERYELAADGYNCKG